MPTRTLSLALAAAVLLFIGSSADGSSADGMTPKKFCECPQHARPKESASVSHGSGYRLFAYNDAYHVPPASGFWCYTRAVWFEAVRASGRFEWTTGRSEVAAGAIKESDDECGAYHNHFAWPTPPVTRSSSIAHGSQLESSKQIVLYHGGAADFAPSWTEQFKNLFSSLTGYGILPQRTSPTRIAIRVASTLRGNAPPYTIDYTIEGFGTSINILPVAKTAPWAAAHPRLHWEAAVSKEYFEAMEQQNKGFSDGGARIKATVSGVQRVQVSVGRLLLLPPGVPPPFPKAEAKNAILVGHASAFLAVPAPTGGSRGRLR